MPRSQAKGNRSVRLARLAFEGIALGVGGTDSRSRVALARRVVRDVGLAWRVAPLAGSSRTVLLAPERGARPPSVASAWEIAHRLRAHRDVVFAEPAFVMPGVGPFAPRPARGAVGGEAPLPGTEDCAWALDLCRVPQAWSATGSLGQGVVVAHPDTGWTAHPELANTRLDAANAFDFVAGVAGALDPLDPPHPGHGTSTASVIASDAGATSRPFVSGMAPCATLMPLRVSSSVVHFSWLRLTAALWHAIDRGAHIVSMSLGGPLASSALEEALEAALDAGTIVVAAAGNQWPFVVYPARYGQAIACAAVNVEKRRWAGSASGPDVDVAAPGESVWRASATRAGFGVDRSSGTSYATAHVAGIAALWLAHHGRSNLVAKYGRNGIPVVFRELLMTAGVAGTPAGWPDDVLGAGIVNAQALLAAPLPARALAAGARVRRERRSARGSALDDLLAYFPGIDPDRVADWLAREFGVRRTALPARLAVLGDEIAFHLTADPTAFASVTRTMRRRTAVPPATRLLFRRASPTLRRALA